MLGKGKKLDPLKLLRELLGCLESSVGTEKQRKKTKVSAVSRHDGSLCTQRQPKTAGTATEAQHAMQI